MKRYEAQAVNTGALLPQQIQYLCCRGGGGGSTGGLQCFIVLNNTFAER